MFYPNPRGSTSYGEEFGNLLYNNYPGDDYHDVMDGVDALIEAGVAEEDRLYVTGGSAGGIMTGLDRGQELAISCRSRGEAGYELDQQDAHGRQPTSTTQTTVSRDNPGRISKVTCASHLYPW